jgi:hypothetical protein
LASWGGRSCGGSWGGDTYTARKKAEAGTAMTIDDQNLLAWKIVMGIKISAYLAMYATLAVIIYKMLRSK